VYNGVRYQEEKPDINTCGRHCMYRILTFTRDGYDLRTHIDELKKIKQNTGKKYDEIIALLINI
jgi:hypothetical protein